MFAANAAVYAIENATTEGKITVVVLLLLSLFSWTIIITKFRQLMIARKATKKFLAAYSSTRDPLDIKKRGEEFDGAPAYALYDRGAEEVLYHLKNNPVEVKGVAVHSAGRRQHGPSGAGQHDQDQHRVLRGGEGGFGGGGGGAGDVAGKRHDCLVHGRGGRAVHRFAGHGLGRHVHVRGHCREQLGEPDGDGARRGGGAGGDGHGPAGGDSGDVRLQLHGDDHPAHHAGAGRLCHALRQPDRARLCGQPRHRGQDRRRVEAP